MRETTLEFGMSVWFAMMIIASTSAEVPFELTVMETEVGYAQGVYDIADIDGDGKNDIVAGGSDPRIWWSKHSSPSNRILIADSVENDIGYEIHAADVDNDGDLDVLTSEGDITWYENPGSDELYTGNPWIRHSSKDGSGSHDFKIGDINGDGLVDCAKKGGIIYIHTDIGVWERTKAKGFNSGEGIALGDVDGDGDLDVADGMAWFECPGSVVDGTCDPFSQWTEHYVGDPSHNLTRVAIVDINADGRKDIVSTPAEFGGSKFIWFEQPEDLSASEWTAHVLYEGENPNFHTLQAGDIDLDGTVDLLVGQTSAKGRRWMYIYYNVNGDGLEWEIQKWQTEKGVWQAVLGDVGSDGDLDILNANFTKHPQAELWENTLSSTRVSQPGRAGRIPAGTTFGENEPRIFDLLGRGSPGGGLHVPTAQGLYIRRRDSGTGIVGLPLSRKSGLNR